MAQLTLQAVRPAPQATLTRDLDIILAGQNCRRVFSDSKDVYFSKTSRLDILDIGNGNAEMSVNLGDEEVRKLIEKDRNNDGDPRIRIMFIDGIQDDPNRIPISSELMSYICEAYHITPRFVGFLSRQEVPGRALHHDRDTHHPIRYVSDLHVFHPEFWYSAVIRSLFQYQNTAPDLSRKVLDWQSFCVWSDYDVFSGNQTCLILRCPSNMKQNFCSLFLGKDGGQLQRHPMLIHSYFVEGVIKHTYDFLGNFSEPLYTWEFQTAEDMHSAEDYTRRSQSFLALARQIRQVATDYDILEDTVNHLQRAHIWYEDGPIRSIASSRANERLSSDDVEEMKRHLADGFERCLKEVRLIRTYNSLYIARAKIGVNECFAMVNQRDADINIKMAAESAKMAVESTQIARSSYQDNRALRVIQIMTMIFLPASLVSSIFGMAFFNTSPGPDGTAKFSISSSWWMYIAVCIPLTLFTLVFMGGFQVVNRNKVMVGVLGDLHQEGEAV